VWHARRCQQPRPHRLGAVVHQDQLDAATGSILKKNSAWFHFVALIPTPWERAEGEDIEDGWRKIPVQVWAPAFRFVFSTLLSPGRWPWLVLAAIAWLTASWSPLVLGFSRTAGMDAFFYWVFLLVLLSSLFSKITDGGGRFLSFLLKEQLWLIRLDATCLCQYRAIFLVSHILVNPGFVSL
jgi:hypothetical protein